MTDGLWPADEPAPKVALRCKSCSRTWTADNPEAERTFIEGGELCSRCRSNRSARRTDRSTSKRAATDVVGRSGSQRHRLLTAYADGTPLTADEAMRRADLNERSCYWKRVSELVAAGLLADTGSERPGEQGSAQRINRITPTGLAAINHQHVQPH